MKLLFALVLVAVCCAAVSSADVTVWATAVSKQESTGRAIIFRYAKALREGFQRTRFPDRVIVAWKYQSASGMPVAQEQEAMNRMEDLLEPFTEKSGRSLLVLVSTGENLREWTYYAKSGQEFLTDFNKALEGPALFPIQIHVAPDPEWSTYERFREGVSK